MKRYSLAVGLFCVTALMGLVCFSVTAFAKDRKDDGDATGPGRLDGVRIKAVERYVQNDSSEFTLGSGVYPLNAYYGGFDVNAGYSFFFNRQFGWEVLRAHYVFTSEKDLTSELADEYGVNPEEIERLRFIFSTSGVFVFAYGKLLLADSYINYFRGLFNLGMAQINTSERSATAIVLGGKFDFFVTDKFSWYLEAREHRQFVGANDHLTFGLGTGIFF